MTALPDWFAMTLIWDRGTETAHHAGITARIGHRGPSCRSIQPPTAPSDDNTNGLLREYLPKGTDLSVHTRADVDAGEKFNDRPANASVTAPHPTEVLAQSAL